MMDHFCDFQVGNLFLIEIGLFSVKQILDTKLQQINCFKNVWTVSRVDCCIL